MNMDLTNKHMVHMDMFMVRLRAEVRAATAGPELEEGGRVARESSW